MSDPARDSLAVHPSHQFNDLLQQHEATTLGMWVFLATEVLFFGGMFAAYALYRYWYPEAFVLGSERLDIVLGGINTGVLLGSSLTMALAVRSSQLGQRRATGGFLLLTMLLGATFLVIKGLEYTHKYHEHLIPGRAFAFESDAAPEIQIFFWLYFVMTGMHAVHMLIGLALLMVLGLMNWKRRFTPQYYFPVEMGGLYWHFVDIVWVFLFPLLYLVDRSN
jgi:cytochrome c oxidase subunit 3